MHFVSIYLWTDCNADCLIEVVISDLISVIVSLVLTAVFIFLLEKKGKAKKGAAR